MWRCSEDCAKLGGIAIGGEGEWVLVCFKYRQFIYKFEYKNNMSLNRAKLRTVPGAVLV